MNNNDLDFKNWKKELKILDIQMKKKNWKQAYMTLDSIEIISQNIDNKEYNAEYLFQRSIIEKLQNNIEDYQEYINKLIEYSNKNKLDKYLLKAHIEIGYTLSSQNVSFAIKNHVQIIEHLKTAMNIAKKLNDIVAFGRINYHLGRIHYIINEMSIAQTYFEEAVEIANETKNRLSIIQTSQSLALIHAHYFRFTEALKYIEKSKKYSDELKDQNELCRLMHNTSYIYAKIGDYKLAVKYAHEAMNIEKTAGLQKEYSRSLVNLGGLYGYLGDLNLSQDYLEKSLEIVRKLKDNQTEEVILANIALLEYEKSNKEKCYEIWNEVFNLNKKTNNIKFKQNWLIYRGLINLKEKKIQEAETDFIQAYHTAKQSETKENIYASLVCLGCISLIKDNIVYGKIMIDHGINNHINLNIKDVLATLYEAIGISYYYIKDYDSARLYFKQSIENYKSMNLEINAKRVEKRLELLN